MLNPKHEPRGYRGSSISSSSSDFRNHLLLLFLEVIHSDLVAIMLLTPSLVTVSVTPVLLLLPQALAAGYTLSDEYTPANFFDKFDFDNVRTQR
jgi:hypothetical protein